MAATASRGVPARRTPAAGHLVDADTLFRGDIPSEPHQEAGGTTGVEHTLFLAPITSIESDPDQPRKHFDQSELNDLATNIRMLRASRGGVEGTGIIQPITVRRSPTTISGKIYYIIVSGERRWRSAKIAGLTHVPVIISDISADRAHEVAIYENLQRSDLTPVEEAVSIRALMNVRKATTRSIAEHLGKHVSWVNNRLALLKLGEDVQELVTMRPDTLISAQMIDRVKEKNARKALISEAKDGLPLSAVKKRVGIINGTPYKDGGDQRYGRKADPNTRVVSSKDIPGTLDAAIRQLEIVRLELREVTVIKKGFDEKVEPRLAELEEKIAEIRALRGKGGSRKAAG